MRALDQRIEAELFGPHDEVDVIGKPGAHVLALTMLATHDKAEFHSLPPISRRPGHCLPPSDDASSVEPHAREENAMTIEPMLTEETPANALVARVLQEAGIEMVFGISGGHTGRIVSGLSQYQNSVRTVLVREESLGGVMAEVYGRLTRRPGVLLGQGPWVLGNGLLGTIEAHLSSSPMLLLTDFSDAPRFSLHAPYQQATGDWGSWDARRAFSGVTKHVMQAHDPIAAGQATRLAIKHALAGQPGPVAVLYSHDSLAGSVAPDSQPMLYPTRHYLPGTPPPAEQRQVEAAAAAILAAERPVLIAGNGVRIARAYDELRQ